MNLSKETWNTNLKAYKHPYIFCSIIYNSQDLEAAQESISGWADKKQWNLYTMEYYLAIKKILPFMKV